MGGAQHLFGNTRNELFFNHPHVFPRSEARAIAETEDVGINGHRVLVKSDIKHDIGRFAPHAWESFKRGAVRRNFALMTVEELLAQKSHIMGLGPPEADGADMTGNAFFPKSCHRARVRCFFKKALGGFVDGFIRGLSGENNADEKLERITENELTFCIRIDVGERRHERLDSCAAHYFWAGRASVTG